jgi:hypothetical protein
VHCTYRFLASCSPTEAVRHRHMESTTRSKTRGCEGSTLGDNAHTKDQIKNQNLS